MANTQRKNIKQLLDFGIRLELVEKNAAALLEGYTMRPRTRVLSIEELRIFLNELEVTH